MEDEIRLEYSHTLYPDEHTWRACKEGEPESTAWDKEKGDDDGDGGNWLERIRDNLLRDSASHD